MATRTALYRAVIAHMVGGFSGGLIMGIFTHFMQGHTAINPLLTGLLMSVSLLLAYLASLYCRGRAGQPLVFGAVFALAAAFLYFVCIQPDMGVSVGLFVGCLAGGSAFSYGMSGMASGGQGAPCHRAS